MRALFISICLIGFIAMPLTAESRPGTTKLLNQCKIALQEQLGESIRVKRLASSRDSESARYELSVRHQTADGQTVRSKLDCVVNRATLQAAILGAETDVIAKQQP